MFPIIQLYCESLDGDTNGFVEYLVGPNKILNSMMSNKLHAAKHSTSTSLLVDPSKFGEEDLEDLEKHHSDGDRGKCKFFREAFRCRYQTCCGDCGKGR